MRVACHLLSWVAATALGIGASSIARAQEVDTAYNPFTTVKLSIKSGTKTTVGCKAVFSGKSSTANPSNNPFQFVWEVEPFWRVVDIPTTSSGSSATVTFKFKENGEEKTLTRRQGHHPTEIASKYLRLGDGEGLFDALKDVKGDLTISIEGDPTEYKYSVGDMKVMMDALDACVETLGPGAACEVAGPQTPRDIATKGGTHRVTFGLAPEVTSLNLCNVHFHVTAEHKGPGFNLRAGGEGGFLCNNKDSLSAAERAVPEGEGCEVEPGQSKLKPGDTIEVHWVYTSCDVKPGKGLDACASKSCVNPALRVESQVFLLVNDRSAAKMSDFDYTGKANSAGLHQAKALPASTQLPVIFRGSTTGRKYNDKGCSPFQATWNVRPQCAKLDIGSLNTWCKGNVFKEKGGHDVRELVVEPARLDPIR